MKLACCNQWKPESESLFGLINLSPWYLSFKSITFICISFFTKSVIRGNADWHPISCGLPDFKGLSVIGECNDRKLKARCKEARTVYKIMLSFRAILLKPSLPVQLNVGNAPARWIRTTSKFFHNCTSLQYKIASVVKPPTFRWNNCQKLIIKRFNKCRLDTFWLCGFFVRYKLWFLSYYLLYQHQTPFCHSTLAMSCYPQRLYNWPIFVGNYFLWLRRKTKGSIINCKFLVSKLETLVWNWYLSHYHCGKATFGAFQAPYISQIAP